MTIEVIGEICNNHNGDFTTACRLIDAAIAAGCTAVKTQLFDPDRVYAGWLEYKEMKRLALSRNDVVRLKEYCDFAGTELIVTPDEIEDAVFLKSIGVKRIKTSSQDVTNTPFLNAVAALGLPVILSTGACTEEEMFSAISDLYAARPNITILHCISCYPAKIEQMNLNVISRLIAAEYLVGLSDHTIGAEAAIMALALGATIFEKHITLDKTQEGPDHAASATPDEMREYVQALKRAESALGDGVKCIMPCEIENRKRYDRFIAPRLGAST